MKSSTKFEMRTFVSASAAAKPWRWVGPRGLRLPMKHEASWTCG